MNWQDENYLKFATIKFKKLKLRSCIEESFKNEIRLLIRQNEIHTTKLSENFLPLYLLDRVDY